MSAVVAAPQGKAIVDAKTDERGSADVNASVSSALVVSPVLTASERLAASRSAMRGAMLDIVNPPKRAPILGGRASSLLDEMMAKARSMPGAAIVMESVSSWWRQHPLRAAGVLVDGATRVFVKPMAQRNPQTLIIGAAVVGALLALTHPWRWLLRPALFIGLLPQLLSQAMKHLPVESWVGMATSVLQRRTAAPAASAGRHRRASSLNPETV
ncbi:MAG: hypothetical protein ABI281_13020 [Caldimonas sp.]